MGPLAGTAPRALAVLVSFILVAISVKAAMVAIRYRRPLTFLSTWSTGLLMFVVSSVAFQAFAWGGADLVTLPAMAAFVAAHGVTLAALLVLGTVTTAGLEFAPAFAPVRPIRQDRSREGQQGARRSREEVIGSLGEGLVGVELQALGWPFLTNVVLAGRGWSVEVDHIVRAPDSLVIIETKTLSGVVTGQPGGAEWRQRTSGGRMRSFMNPLRQNDAHMTAVRNVIAIGSVALRGLVVSAGHARFDTAIAGCVVPVRDLADVLRGSTATPLFGKAAIDTAWNVLCAEAVRSDERREAHVANVRSRRRQPWW